MIVVWWKQQLFGGSRYCLVEAGSVEASIVWWKQVLFGGSKNCLVEAGSVEASIEIDGNVRWVGAGAVGGFLRKWLHISWDQHHLAKPKVPFLHSNLIQR